MRSRPVRIRYLWSKRTPLLDQELLRRDNGARELKEQLHPALVDSAEDGQVAMNLLHLG